MLTLGAVPHAHAQARVDDPCIVKLLGVITTGKPPLKVILQVRCVSRRMHAPVAGVLKPRLPGPHQYCDGGSLSTYLSSRGTAMALKERLRFASAIADGMAALDTAGVVHGGLRVRFRQPPNPAFEDAA